MCVCERERESAQIKQTKWETGLRLAQLARGTVAFIQSCACLVGLRLAQLATLLGHLHLLEGGALHGPVRVGHDAHGRQLAGLSSLPPQEGRLRVGREEERERGEAGQ